jgi:hypothetical protein
VAAPASWLGDCLDAGAECGRRAYSLFVGDEDGLDAVMKLFVIPDGAVFFEQVEDFFQDHQRSWGTAHQRQFFRLAGDFSGGTFAAQESSSD